MTERVSGIIPHTTQHLEHEIELNFHVQAKEKSQDSKRAS